MTILWLIQCKLHDEGLVDNRYGSTAFHPTNTSAVYLIKLESIRVDLTEVRRAHAFWMSSRESWRSNSSSRSYQILRADESRFSLPVSTSVFLCSPFMFCYCAAKKRIEVIRNDGGEISVSNRAKSYVYVVLAKLNINLLFVFLLAKYWILRSYSSNSPNH